MLIQIFRWLGFIFTRTFEDFSGFKVYPDARLPRLTFTPEATSFFLSFFGGDQNYYIERNNFLNYTCYFPRSLKKSLPYSQLLQIRRIYSSKEELEKQAKKRQTQKHFKWPSP